MQFPLLGCLQELRETLLTTIQAIQVMPCYGVSGEHLTVIKSGYRMESSLWMAESGSRRRGAGSSALIAFALHSGWLACHRFHFHSSVLDKKECPIQVWNVFFHSTPVWFPLWAKLSAILWIPREEESRQVCFKKWTTLRMKSKCKVSWKVSDNAP